MGISGLLLTVAAGTSAELAIAPMARLCSTVSRGVEIAGIIFGLLTGGHLLVIVCVKKLLISQADRMLAKGVAEFLQGSDTDKPSPSVLRIPAHTLDGAAGKLHQALGQDVDRWITHLMERQNEDNLAALHTPLADPSRTLRERLSEESLRNLRRQQGTYASYDDAIGNVLRIPLARDHVVRTSATDLPDNELFCVSAEASNPGVRPGANPYGSERRPAYGRHR